MFRVCYTKTLEEEVNKEIVIQFKEFISLKDAWNFYLSIVDYDENASIYDGAEKFC